MKTIVETLVCPKCQKIYTGKCNLSYHLKHFHFLEPDEIKQIKKDLNFSNIIMKSEIVANESRKRHSLKTYGTNCILQSQLIKDKIKQTNLEKYGVENPVQSDIVKNKMKETNLERYGAEYPQTTQAIKNKITATCQQRYNGNRAMCSKEVQQKQKNTMFERYGVAYNFQVPMVKDKIKKTMMDRYGVEHGLQSDIIREKVKKTNLEKYGAEWQLSTKQTQDKITATCQQKYNGNRAMCSDVVQKKVGETMIERYGVQYNSQRDEHAQYQFNRKEYIFPSGRKVLVQGYEDQAINFLLKEGILEDNIIIGSAEIRNIIGPIWYDRDNEQHRYFPDIYIKDIEVLVEVKCPYTLKCNKEINIEKFKAAIAGHKFKLILIDTDSSIQTFDNNDALVLLNEFND